MNGFEKQYRKVWLLGACVWCLSSTIQAYATTFTNPDISASAAGVANAVASSAEDVSAAFFNPAGLAWHEGVQAMISNQSRYRNNNASIAGTPYEGDLNLTSIDTFALSWLPKGGEWGIAGSISMPYIHRANWGSAFPTLGLINLKMRRYASDVFWRVNNTLAVTAGLDIYDTSLVLNTGGSSFSGSDWSDVGIHAGLRWEFVPFWTLGVHMRQGVNAKASDSTGSSLHMQLPDELTLGVSHHLFDDELLVALDIKHSTWSNFGDLNVSNNGVNIQSLAVDLRDTTDVMLGVTWFWRHNTQLRIGYGYEQAANTTSAYQPMIGDLDGHRLSIGLGGMMSGMHLDMAYTVALYPQSSVNGVYAGQYQDERYSLIFSLSKKF